MMTKCRMGERQMRVVLGKGAYLIERAHEQDAGYDFRSPVRVVLKACDTTMIDTGVHVELPPSTVGMVRSRSSMHKKGIITSGTIDEGYTGSIVVALSNLSDEDYVVERGDKIAQLVITPVLRPSLFVVDALAETERGNGGFGSTGR